jgi:fatty acid desaturase
MEFLKYFVLYFIVAALFLALVVGAVLLIMYLLSSTWGIPVLVVLAIGGFAAWAAYDETH